MELKNGLYDKLNKFLIFFSLGVFILCNFAYFQNFRIWQYSPPPRHRRNIYLFIVTINAPYLYVTFLHIAKQHKKQKEKNILCII
jgi:hypothetical protein